MRVGSVGGDGVDRVKFSIEDYFLLRFSYVRYFRLC
jgi:hypothetical protein